MNIEVRVATGDVFREVMALAHQVNVDVLLCGTEGKSFVDYLFSGSVSEDLALKGEGRTMTVRYDLLDATEDAGRLGREFARRLVVPTDFSSSSMRALLSAFARPAEALGTLHILHVLAEGEGRADAEAHMRALTALAEEHGTDFVAEIRAGEIAPTILAYLEEVDATGIITGPARDESAGPRAARQRVHAPAARRTLPGRDPALRASASSRRRRAVPRRTDISKILVIGSGPIVIGQACEFDYSGAQACKVLEEDGYEVVLVNSNPATIMTDPGLASRTYVEPITPEFVEKVIEAERPDALLPTLGGPDRPELRDGPRASPVCSRSGASSSSARRPRSSRRARTASCSPRPWGASGSTCR